MCSMACTHRGSKPDSVLSLLMRRAAPGPGLEGLGEGGSPGSHRGLLCMCKPSPGRLACGLGLRGLGLGLGQAARPSSVRAAGAPVQCSTKRWAMSRGTATWPPWATAWHSLADLCSRGWSQASTLSQREGRALAGGLCRGRSGASDGTGLWNEQWDEAEAEAAPLARWCQACDHAPEIAACSVSTARPAAWGDHALTADTSAGTSHVQGWCNLPATASSPVAQGAEVVGPPAGRVGHHGHRLALKHAHAHPGAPPQQLALQPQHPASEAGFELDGAACPTRAACSA